MQYTFDLYRISQQQCCPMLQPANAQKDFDLHFYTICHADYREADLFVFELGFDLFTCSPPAELKNIKCLKTGASLTDFLLEQNSETLSQLRVVNWQEVTPFDFYPTAQVLGVVSVRTESGFVSGVGFDDINPENRVVVQTFVLHEASGSQRGVIPVTGQLSSD